MLDPKILIFILLLILFYFVFGYQENFEQIDDYNKRLSNLDGRPVKDTDTNYQYVSNDCKIIGKTPFTLPTIKIDANGIPQTVFVKTTSCIDNCNNRLVNIDGKCVKNTDTNYQYVSNDCKMIGKETTLCDMQQKYKIINNVKYPDGFEFKGIQCLNKKV